MLKPIAAAAVAGAVLVLAGCGGGDSVQARDSAVQVEVGDTINYGSTGTTTTLDCATGKSLTIGGSNNTVTVKGSCTSVNIGGADNKVTLDAVTGDITTVGLNNTVVYKSGDPKLNDVGTDNSISKG